MNVIAAKLRRFPGAHRALLKLREAGARAIYGGVRHLAPIDSRWGGPKGGFSAFEELSEGRVAGRILVAGQDVAEPDSDTMQIRSGLNQRAYQPWPIFWTHHDQMRLVGPSLLPMDREKRVCLEALHLARPSSVLQRGHRFLLLPEQVHLEGKWLSLASCFSASFFHWIYEELPKLWVLDDLPPETKILIPKPTPPYIAESIAMLGLQERTFPIEATNIGIADFYFAAPTAMMGCQNPFAIKWLRSHFSRFLDRDETLPSKLFLQRRQSTRGCTNVGEVEESFAARGWTLINPETLTFEQQIRLFANADAIAGLHGGSFTNLIWARPGTRVLEVFSDNYLNGCYEGIAMCLDLNYRYLVFPANSARQATVDLGRVHDQLADLEAS